MDQAEGQLPDPPRRLPAVQRLAFTWGHPLVVWGLALLVPVVSLGWLLLVAYGVPASALWALLGSRQALTAEVEKRELQRLVTGEVLPVTTARFSWEGQTYRVHSFGPSQLQPGQAVSVLMPRQRPQEAWIAGLQRFPISLRGLARVLGLLALPGCGLVGFGLGLARRQRRLLEEGGPCQARRLRQWSLPRPWADLRLERYALEGSAARTFWSLGKPLRSPALALQRGSQTVLLARCGLEEGQESQLVVSRGRHRGALGVGLLGLGQVLLTLLWLVL